MEAQSHGDFQIFTFSHFYIPNAISNKEQGMMNSEVKADSKMNWFIFKLSNYQTNFEVLLPVKLCSIS